MELDKNEQENSELISTELNSQDKSEKFVSILKKFVQIVFKICAWILRAIWYVTKLFLLLIWQVIRLALNIILAIILPHKKDARFKSGYSKKMFRF